MSLPLHSMPILYLPRKVRLRFDLLQRDFLGEVVPWIILGTWLSEQLFVWIKGMEDWVERICPVLMRLFSSMELAFCK